MTPGSQTSEFTVTKWLLFVGGALEALALVLEAIRPLLPTWQWLSVALLVVGALLQVAVALGYQRSRTQVKTATLGAAALSSARPSDEVVVGTATAQPPASSPS